MVVTFNVLFFVENHDKLLNAVLICFIFLMSNFIEHLDLMKEYVCEVIHFFFTTILFFQSQFKKIIICYLYSRLGGTQTR